jgi:hypothetical protein
VSAVTLGELISSLQDHPEICGLEEVMLDNINNTPANALDSRVQDKQRILLIYSEKATAKSMPLHAFIKSLKTTIGVYGLTLDNLVFADDSISLPKPVATNMRVENGIVYLRYVES